MIPLRADRMTEVGVDPERRLIQAMLSGSWLQCANISDEIVEFRVRWHVTAVRLLGVNLPHEFDRIAERRRTSIVKIWSSRRHGPQRRNLEFPASADVLKVGSVQVWQDVTCTAPGLA